MEYKYKIWIECIKQLASKADWEDQTLNYHQTGSKLPLAPYGSLAYIQRNQIWKWALG